MLLDSDSLEFIEKSITRADAKKVHKELPEGGAWRTMNGHHIYIVNGKIVAGSVPGVTKAKKMTKATMAEHQAKIDAKGKKPSAKKPSKTTTKATKSTKPKSGASAKGQGTKKNPTGKTKPAAKKSPVKASKAEKAQKEVQAAMDSMLPAKKASKPKTPKPPKDTTLQDLANASNDGMDMLLQAGDDPKKMSALKEALKSTEGNSTKEKLSNLHKQYKTQEKPEWAPSNDKAFDDFQADKPKKEADSLTVKHDKTKTNHASAPSGTAISIGSSMLDGSTPEDAQKHILTHEVGHVISNLHPSLERHILDNPQGALGRLNTKKGYFEGNFGTHTPEESFAESYAVYHNNPKELKERYPKAYEFMKAVDKKLPHHKSYLDKAQKEYAKLKEPKPVIDPSKNNVEHYELYHGTKLPNVEGIKRDGFSLNGTEDDFGDAVYFKSPSFDAIDHADQQKKIAKFKESSFSQDAINRMEKHRGNDTANIVSGFAGREAAVIHAVIPKKHVLDCTNGRPKELQDLIHAWHESEDDPAQIRKLAFKHILGEDKDSMSNMDVMNEFSNRKKEFAKAMGKERFSINKLSPYEVYAHQHKIGAIVDKLVGYDEEGWQIGVYDPKIIQIKDVGKGIQWNEDKKAPELVKALIKSLRKAKVPYCLLHYHMDKDGLHMHIGASGGKKK